MRAKEDETMFTLECQLREQITELENTLSSTVSARDLTIRDLKEELRQARDWEDVDDEWTEQIKAAHPTRSGSHDEYGIAMRMVGHRHSKGELVALVNWLLVQGGAAADEREAREGIRRQAEKSSACSTYSVRHRRRRPPISRSRRRKLNGTRTYPRSKRNNARTPTEVTMTFDIIRIPRVIVLLGWLLGFLLGLSIGPRLRDWAKHRASR
jgi:hypothetical protein